MSIRIARPTLTLMKARVLIRSSRAAAGERPAALFMDMGSGMLGISGRAGGH